MQFTWMWCSVSNGLNRRSHINSSKLDVSTHARQLGDLEPGASRLVAVSVTCQWRLTNHLVLVAMGQGHEWGKLVSPCGPVPVFNYNNLHSHDGITSGQVYQFQVRAANIYGWGSFSTAVSVKAATVPSQMLDVVTSADTSTGGVQISWSAPTSTGGDAITAYKVEVSDSLQANWYVDTIDCDGGSASILSARSCIISMLTLT